jgi:hypothetical protein
MIASSMNAEVLMLQRAVEVRQGSGLSALSAIGFSLAFGFRSDFEDFLILADGDRQLAVLILGSSVANSTANLSLRIKSLESITSPAYPNPSGKGDLTVRQ